MNPRAILLTVFAVSGCGRAERPAPPDDQPVVPSLVISSEAGEQRSYGRQLRGMAMRGQFDSLDAIIRQLRESRVRFPDGNWKLRAFYYYATDLEEEAARVALAGTLEDWAWYARSHGAAATVSEKDVQLFAERLTEAGKVLVEARALEEHCPGWSVAALNLFPTGLIDREALDSISAQALAREPEYWSIYFTRANFLLERWGSRKGEMESFLEDTYHRLPAPLGAEAYARAVWNMADDFDNVFEDTELRWETTKQGFEAAMQRLPESIALPSELAWLAVKAGDRSTAARLFHQLGDGVDLGVWKRRELFIQGRRWALEGS